jgi:hypothetical protein
MKSVYKTVADRYVEYREKFGIKESIERVALDTNLPVKQVRQLLGFKELQ